MTAAGSRPAPSARPALRAVLAKGHLRLVLPAVMLASLLLTGGGLMLLRGYAEQNLGLAARSLGYAVEPAVFFDDRMALRAAVESVAASSDLERVEVRAADGAVLLDWRSAEPATAGLPAWAPFRLAEARLPITDPAGQRLGTLVVAAHPGRLVLYALWAIVISLGAIALAALATRYLARKLEAEVVAPIERVALVAAQIRTRRDFSLRAGGSDIAEIHALNADFDGLIAEMQLWHEGFLAENRSLAHRADHDPLTGLGNRAAFDRLLGQALEGARGGSGSVALLFVDVDGFKTINDRHGHGGGDAVLVALAQRLAAGLRARDKAFRVGGDEFVVVLDTLVREPDPGAVIERVRCALEQPIAMADGSTCEPQVSIGAASWPEDGGEVSAIVAAADRRMYADKQLKRRHARRA